MRQIGIIHETKIFWEQDTLFGSRISMYFIAESNFSMLQAESNLALDTTAR